MSASMLLEWLPPLIKMSPWDEQVLESLYAVFVRDLVRDPPFYRGGRVWCFPDQERGRECLFWHITEREDPPHSGNRLPDFRRCERLCWIRALIEHADDPAVKAWDYQEGSGDVHTYLWLETFDYVVVMKRYPDGRRRLITAYRIDYESKRHNLRKKYAHRLP